MGEKNNSEDDRDDVAEPRKTLSEEEIIKTLLSSSSVSLKDLVPGGPLKSENVVKVALWILSSHSKKKSLTSILQRIKWLTAVVQYEVVDSLADLEKLFNPFIQLIFVSQYQASICHLLSMIATPKIYKFQVERILRNTHTVGLTNPLAGLLSRLKALRPDLVPQTIPQQSSAMSFPKAPPSIRNGFYALSERIQERNEHPNAIAQSTDYDGKRVTKKMRLDILPKVQHVSLKASHEVDYGKITLLTQFKTFDELLPKIISVELPNHVGSLLSKRQFHYVLALNYTSRMEGLLSQWLYLTLCHEFMEKRLSLSEEGKTLLLSRIIEFQRSTGLKIIAVYDFLSEYLQTWDGVNYRNLIFQLISDVPFLPYNDLHENFLRVLEDLFHSSETDYRIKIIDLCRSLIYNLLIQKFGPAEKAKILFSRTYSATNDELAQHVEGIYVVSEVIRFSERLLNMGLTSSKDLSFILHSLLFYSWLIEVEAEFQLPFRTFCQPITVYSALFSPAPATVSLLCRLLSKYSDLGRKQLIQMSTHPELEEFLKDAMDNASILSRYVLDTSDCLVYQKAFKLNRNSWLSLVPRKFLKQVSEDGSYRAAFDLKRHPAFNGVARKWTTTQRESVSKANDSRTSPEDLFQEVDRDSDGYILYLFSCFPSIRDYISKFHGN